MKNGKTRATNKGNSETRSGCGSYGFMRKLVSSFLVSGRLFFHLQSHTWRLCNQPPNQLRPELLLYRKNSSISCWVARLWVTPSFQKSPFVEPQIRKNSESNVSKQVSIWDILYTSRWSKGDHIFSLQVVGPRLPMVIGVTWVAPGM